MTARSRVMQVQAYFPDMPYSPNIYPEGYWRKTGMRVFTGEKLRIEATGTIGWPAPPMGPDGDVDNEFAIHSSQGDLLWERTPRVPFLKLIGRIGTSNTNRFEIGAAYNGIATASGELYLAINDRVRYFYDNNGAFEVTINIGMDAPEDEGESDPPFNYSGDDDETSCHPISLRKGEKREQVIDLRLNTSVGSLDFIRYYRQSKQADTTFQFMGLGWTHNHDIVLNAAGLPDVIDVLTANGGMTRFRQSLTDPGLYEGVAGSNSRIEVDSGSTDARYLLTAEDYSLYVFDSQGRLRCKEWLSGDVWTYSYDVSELYTGKPKLLSIEDNDGHSLSFAYGNPDNEYAHPLLIHVEDHTGRQVNFSYSPEKEDGVVIGTFGSRQALLTGVEDVRQQDWRYVYYGAAAGEDESSLFNLLLEVHSPPVDTDGDGSTDSLLLLKRLHYSFETDLAVNGGMETDSDWWLIPGLEASINEQVMTEADTGSASRHMSANDGRGIEGQPWNLVQGRTYTLRARVRQVSGTLKMQVNQLTTFSAQSVNTSGWQTLETTYTHAGDIMEGCRLQFIAEGGSAEFYVDTVSILETTPEISIITQERGLSKTLSNGVVSNPLARETLQLEPGGDPITLETDAAGKTLQHLFAGEVYYGTRNAAGHLTSQLLADSYRPIEKQDARGNSTAFTWSENGKLLLEVADAAGEKTEFDYNTDETLNFSRDVQQRKTVYTYGDLNHPRLPTVIKLMDSDDLTVLQWQTRSYDSRGRVLSEQVLDPADGTTLLHEVTRTYHASGDGAGLLHTITQVDIGGANDQTITYLYDSTGRVVQVNQSSTFGGCQKARTIYDAAGHMVASICNYDNTGSHPATAAEAVQLRQATSDPDLNRVMTYEYDAMGRRVKTTLDAGTSYADTTVTVYDALDRVVRTIAHFDGTGVSNPYTAARSAFSYGSDFSRNHITDTFYNERGLVRKQVDLLENVTLYGYDDAGRLIKTIQNASQPTYDNSYGVNGDPTLSGYVANNEPDEDLIMLSAYDANGNLIKSTDASGQVTLYGYDALNRPVRTIRNASTPDYSIAADPTLAGYSLDEAVDSDQVSTTAYDAMGRVIRMADPDGRVTLYGYDALGRQVMTIQSASQPAYDIAADPDLSSYVAGSNADEDIISHTTYDPEGRTLYTEDVNGNRAWAAYDGLGRQVKTIVNAVGTDTDGGSNDPRSSSYTPAADADRDLMAETHYDAEGRVKWAKEVLGRYTLFGYDNLNRRVRVIRNATDPNYDTVTDPDLSSYPLSSSADEDSLTRTVYDAQGRVEKTFDARGNETRYEYDTLGRQTRIIVNYGDGVYSTSAPDEDLITQTVYDSQGRVAQTIDPAGMVTRYEYDQLGRRVKTITNFVDGSYNPLLPDEDLISATIYNRAGQVIQTTDARGTKTVFTYDGVGRRLTMTRAAETALAVTDYTCYDRAGRVLRTIQNWLNTGVSPDARDEQGNWLFNPTDHGPDNDQNLITRYVYDQVGRVIQVINPAGDSRSTTYAKDGRVLATTDPEGSVTIQHYDALRRVIRTVQAYLANGEDPALWVWDAPDNRWETSNGTFIDHGEEHTDRNIIVDVTYDKAGRRLSLRDPRGSKTDYAYDALDRRTGLTNPIAQTWTTTYADVTGGSSSVTLLDPLNFETERVFDRLGRLKQINYLNETPKYTPDVTFTYDAAGNRVKMSESNGSPARETLYTYDDVRRLKQVDVDTDGDSVVEQTVAYQYDAGGLRTRLTLPGNLAVVYTYNQRGQLIDLTDWDNQVVSYDYDAIGRLKLVQRSNHVDTRFGYDPASRLRDLHHSAGSSTLLRLLYEVDGRSNRTQVQEITPTGTPISDTIASHDERVDYYAGTWQTDGAFEGSSNLNAALRIAFVGQHLDITLGTGPDHGICDIYVDRTLWGSRDTCAATAGEETFSLSAYADGPHLLEIRNRVEKNLASSGHQLRFKQVAVMGAELAVQTLHYTYDALSRLVQADYYTGAADYGTPFRQYHYAYDLAGNRLSNKLALNGAVQSDIAYTYNRANQLADDGMNTFTWDANGNLTGYGTNTFAWDRANRLRQMSDGTDTYAYAYNGLGQRVGQTLNPSGSSVVTEYLLDVQPRLYKVLASTIGANITRYLHDPHGIFAQENPDSTWRWMVKDGLGSVRQVVDSGADVLASADFDPYGVIWQQAGTPQTPYGFTGEPSDDNGLVYLRARHYDPMMAVFQSLDPLETPNRYAYANSNPVNLTDPSGLAPNCKPDSQQDENTCVPSPSGSSIDVKSDFYNLFNQWGVLLTVNCNATDPSVVWSKENRDKLIAAFRDVSANGITFRQTFGGLEFRLTDTDIDGPTVYATSNINNPRIIVLDSDWRSAPYDNARRNTIHELGHVLYYRTNMRSILANDAGRLRINRSDVTNAQDRWLGNPNAQGAELILETAADIFYFWVADDIGITISDGDVYTFAEGGTFQEVNSPGFLGWARQARNFLSRFELFLNEYDTE